MKITEMTAVLVMIIIAVIWGIWMSWTIGPDAYEALSGWGGVYDRGGELYFDYLHIGLDIPTVEAKAMDVSREEFIRIMKEKTGSSYYAYHNDFPPLIYFLSWIPITIIAIIFSILGILKDDAKKILAAAILYVVPLFTIPSAVLCFICFAKIRKNSHEEKHV